MKIKQIIAELLPKGASVVVYDTVSYIELSPENIIQACDTLHRAGLQLKTMTALDERKAMGHFRIVYVFGSPAEHAFIALNIQTKNEFPSLTPTIHYAALFERKIATFFGLVPIGHPDTRPLILHENWPNNVFPLRKDVPWNERPLEAKGEYEFFKIDGEGIYEIPVGPVHAGIIEPGHFRFSVAGEEIVLLEPRLGFSHKGSEKLFETLELEDKLRLSERISGDSSFSHSLAFCQAIESLGGLIPSSRVRYLRTIFCELERLANHFGDIGAIMLDTGFNFGGSAGSRIRERIMQMNELLTGSRFLRGVNAIGGSAADIDLEKAAYIVKELEALRKDFSEVIEVANNKSSLIERLQGTGRLLESCARDHGVVGVAGRAVGLSHDARIDYPYAAYSECPISIAVETSGDVAGRFFVRVNEAYASIDCIISAVQNIPTSESAASGKKQLKLAKNAYAIGITEGWRGDIVYFVATDAVGSISRVDVRDPSFLNWPAIEHAGRGNMVPDFPLINKSFNLSYSGNDL